MTTRKGTAADIGTKDGARFGKDRTFTPSNALSVARAAERTFWKRVDQGAVTADDVVGYGQAFIHAASASGDANV